MFTSGISDITAMSWSRPWASAKTLCCLQHSEAARSGMPLSEAMSAEKLRTPQARATRWEWSAPGVSAVSAVSSAMRLSSGSPGGLGRQTSGMRAAIAGFIALLPSTASR
ncbi:hypothetical protein ACFQX6_43890 [Streptosporangium lutulentum]